MIANARALDTEWVPLDVIHRNIEKNRLSGALQSLADGAPNAQHIVCTGPPGAGKTCLARYTVERLRENALGVRTVYVDCWVDSSSYQVLYTLLGALGRSGTVHRSTPRDELFRHLREADTPLVAILDEADRLEDAGLLRRLYGIDGLVPIFIGSSMGDIVAPLDTHVRSRIRNGATIRFEAYDHDTLLDILAARADAGLVPGSITPRQLGHIADAAAGNARDGIGILREATERATAAGVEAIRDGDIEAAIPEAKQRLRQTDLQNIGANHRLVYSILQSGDGLAPRYVHEQYCERADASKTKRTVRSYLSKLEHYNLAWSTGQGRARKYYAQSLGSS